MSIFFFGSSFRFLFHPLQELLERGLFANTIKKAYSNEFIRRNISLNRESARTPSKTRSNVMRRSQPSRS